VHLTRPRAAQSQPFDIGFTGSSGPKYPLRMAITRALRAMPLRTYFGSWDPHNSANGGNGSWWRLSRKGYVEQLARTKMWVSTTGPEGIVGTRFFEVMASGTTLLLCNRVNTPSLWEDGVHVVMFDSMAELRSKVRHYLQFEAERRRIVGAARALVLERHTWEARAAFLTKATEDAIARHTSSGEPWFRPARRTSPSRSRLLGCYIFPPAGREGKGANISFVKQERFLAGMPYPRGFNVSDCEQTCGASAFFGMYCGGFCRGDAHYRGDCFCGSTAAFRELQRSGTCTYALRCNTTCSLTDERPCGGPRAMAVYRRRERSRLERADG